MKKNVLFLLLCSALTLPSAAQDNPTYCLLTNAGDSIDAAQVNYLAADADSPNEFNVVMKGGRVYTRVTSLTPVGTATAIKSVKAELPGILVLGDNVIIQSPERGQTLSVCKPDGQQLRIFHLAAGRQTVDISALPAGVYILKTGQSAVKFINPHCSRP